MADRPPRRGRVTGWVQRVVVGYLAELRRPGASWPPYASVEEIARHVYGTESPTRSQLDYLRRVCWRTAGVSTTTVASWDGDTA